MKKKKKSQQALENNQRNQALPRAATINEAQRNAAWLSTALGCEVQVDDAARNLFTADGFLFLATRELEFVDPDWGKVPIYRISVHSPGKWFSVWEGLGCPGSDVLAALAAL